MAMTPAIDKIVEVAEKISGKSEQFFGGWKSPKIFL
jgi:hypothetical protein